LKKSDWQGKALELWVPFRFGKRCTDAISVRLLDVKVLFTLHGGRLLRSSNIYSGWQHDRVSRVMATECIKPKATKSRLMIVEGRNGYATYKDREHTGYRDWESRNTDSS
jgi:hypothetical protein